MWNQAKKLAQQAPPERNRYVDFLRALSILAVVSGHWLVAAPYVEGGAVVGGHLLGILPWTQWLTWGFQVMPLFFLVGGFSNGVSWSANRRDSGTFSGWYTGRLARLIWPVLPLFLIWTGFALTGTMLGVERGIVKMAAQLALIPVWFLSVYLIVSALVPLSYAAWQRWGIPRSGRWSREPSRLTLRRSGSGCRASTSSTSCSSGWRCTSLVMPGPKGALPPPRSALPGRWAGWPHSPR